MNELVSVIVPVYNTEEYLEECLDSILEQTYKNLEVILVNDGSTDNSSLICSLYEERDSRVCVINKENGGLSSARNAGIRKANGEYLVFVDSDDIVAPFFVEAMVSSIQLYDCDISCCESVKFIEDGSNKARKCWSEFGINDVNGTIYTKERAIKDNLYEKIRITEIPYKVYRRQVFKDIFFPEGIIYEDLAVTFRLFMNANQIVVLNKKLYGYRKRKQSIISSKFGGRNMSSVRVAQILQEHLGNDPLYQNAAANACFRINRVAFSKVPYHMIRSQIWEQITTYRKEVMLDKEAKTYERLLAFSSFLGPLFFRFTVGLFERLKYGYYHIQK
ncbi:glycosyltransferase family 2 protein [Butyrivibrio sp. INlla14]|uniref:glycosyltransferase family 2 protein n=1 Tax=Butyrivibrio sp. INlla14 TaxID=1520808 RepID=UPI000875F470|nr:glycosyltransferase family 2 protein [Butyrivibrio sp. INlla14]SCY42657.1 Glycosyl transferase family 2 [Butyrivibrio sp. INlla14]